MKFDALETGMVVYDLCSHRMGNTTIRTLSLYEVKIIAVDPNKREVVYSWNGNRAESGSEYCCARWTKKKPVLVRSNMGYYRKATREEIAAIKAKGE